MRLEEWDQTYSSVLQSHMNQPFEWGVSDCFIMAMDIHVALTGEDLYPEERGRYKSKIGASRRLRASGYTSVEEAISSKLSEVPVSMAQRGDFGIVDTDDGPALVVFDAVLAFGKSETGYIRVPRNQVQRAFRVG